MKVNRIIGLAVTCAGLLAGCDDVAMSQADLAFDTALTAALARDRPIDLALLEKGDWSQVCAIGEDRPSSMFPGGHPRPGETAFDTLMDAAFLAAGRAGGGALAFAYSDGVEVRPLSGLPINMGSAINRCVPREAAVLVDTPDAGWRFRGHQ